MQVFARIEARRIPLATTEHGDGNRIVFLDFNDAKSPCLAISWVKVVSSPTKTSRVICLQPTMPAMPRPVLSLLRTY